MRFASGALRGDAIRVGGQTEEDVEFAHTAEVESAAIVEGAGFDFIDEGTQLIDFGSPVGFFNRQREVIDGEVRAFDVINGGESVSRAVIDARILQDRGDDLLEDGAIKARVQDKVIAFMEEIGVVGFVQDVLDDVAF